MATALMPMTFEPCQLGRLIDETGFLPVTENAPTFARGLVDAIDLEVGDGAQCRAEPTLDRRAKEDVSVNETEVHGSGGRSLDAREHEATNATKREIAGTLLTVQHVKPRTKSERGRCAAVD